MRILKIILHCLIYFFISSIRINYYIQFKNFHVFRIIQTTNNVKEKTFNFTFFYNFRIATNIMQRRGTSLRHAIVASTYIKCIQCIIIRSLSKFRSANTSYCFQFRGPKRNTCTSRIISTPLFSRIILFYLIMIMQ